MRLPQPRPWPTRPLPRRPAPAIPKPTRPVPDLPTAGSTAVGTHFDGRAIRRPARVVLPPPGTAAAACTTSSGAPERGVPTPTLQAASVSCSTVERARLMTAAVRSWCRRPHSVGDAVRWRARLHVHAHPGSRGAHFAPTPSGRSGRSLPSSARTTQTSTFPFHVPRAGRAPCTFSVAPRPCCSGRPARTASSAI